MTAAAHEPLVSRLIDKIRSNVDDIVMVEEHYLADAEVVVVSYGISARIAYRAVELARDAGIRCGLLRLATVWPFPEQRIRELAVQINAFVVPEINYGQLVLEVERCAGGNATTILVGHAGGHVHAPREIVAAIEAAAAGRRRPAKEKAYAH